MERAAYYSEYGERAARRLHRRGRSATRRRGWSLRGGRRPLRLRQRARHRRAVQEQVNEANPARVQQVLNRIQQMMVDV
jgi:hypothetical protein